jgi:regulator of cell morphogenesis and NO signaling
VRSLADACAVHGLDADHVVARLEAAARAGRGKDDTVGWATQPLAALIEHLVGTYHASTRAELPRLRQLAADAQETSRTRPELCTIAALLAELESDMLPHLVKEERILFPYIVELEKRARAGNQRPLAPPGAKDHPMRAMMREHHHADGTLRKLRHTASHFVAPVDASPTHRELYEGLERLERTMHHHVHLESNVLFRRALELELP